MKKQAFDNLISSLSNCSNCQNLKSSKNDCSLINIFKNQEFAKNIPSIWTDWYNRLDAKVMIIGQDWGPYEDMKKLNLAYCQNKNNKNWQYLIEQETSLTKKQLTKFIEISSKGKYKNLDKFYITNSILCARQGSYYRSNNINLKKSTHLCVNYLKEQINIIKPQVILTLGYYPLMALSEIFNFQLNKTLKECIKSMPIIRVEKYTIIPLYHPVAQVKKEEQLAQYEKIWENLK